MYVHEGRSIAFLDAPRTASNAVLRVLYDRGFRRVGPSHSVGDLTGLRSVTVVRNHFDALASLRCMEGFASVTVDWLRDEAPALLERYGGFVRHRLWWRADHADYVIRYEDLEDTLARWLTDEEMETITSLDRLGPSKRGGAAYRDIITRDARRLIEDEYSAEMDALGYRW